LTAFTKREGLTPNLAAASFTVTQKRPSSVFSIAITSDDYATKDAESLG